MLTGRQFNSQIILNYFSNFDIIFILNYFSNFGYYILKLEGSIH